MYLRTVLGSRPVRRAIAVTDSPCRCSSRIIISSPSWTIGAASPREGDGTDVGSTIQPGLAPAEWLAETPTREFSKPTIRENRRTHDTSDRSSLHRCLKRQRHLVPAAGAAKRKFKAYPIGYFHIDIAELCTAEGKLYLFVAIDRTSK